MRMVRRRSSETASMACCQPGVQTTITSLTGAAMLRLASALARRTCSTILTAACQVTACSGAVTAVNSSGAGHGLPREAPGALAAALST